MASKKIPDLIVSIDLGGSLTKVVAQKRDGTYCPLAISSEIVAIPADILQDVQANHWGKASPESAIWIVTKDGSGYALGSYARKQFLAHSDLKVSKLELAVPKILGVLWVLQQKLKLPKRFSVFLGVLLPAEECSKVDQQDLIDRLLPELESFTTPTGEASIQLKSSPVIKPEGAGVFLAYKTACDPEYIERKRVGILGIGYRNSNLLVMSHGAVGQNDRYTDELGFSTLIDSVRSEIGSTIDEVKLASVVGEAGSTINREFLENYLATIGKSNRIEGVIEAIRRSRKMYLFQLESWLKRVGVDTLDSVVLYGGTTEYFKKELTDRFSDFDNVVWHGGVSIPEDLLNSMLVDRCQTALEYRFIDPWCFLHYICDRQKGYSQWGLNKLIKGLPVAEVTEAAVNKEVLVRA